MPDLHAWSYSVIKSHETCPFRHHAEKVEKLYPYVETKHTRYGKDVHKAAENYIGKGVELHPGYAAFKAGLDVLKNASGEKLCEFKMAITEDKVPCAYFDKKTWCRGVADLVILSDDGKTAKAVDYKTGGDKYPDVDQLELMAMLLFAHYPKLEKVKGLLWFMTRGTLFKGVYHKSDEKKLWKKWGAKSAALDKSFELDKWPAKTNGLCKNWCPVEHCVYNGAN